MSTQPPAAPAADETPEQALERGRAAAVAKRWNEAHGICQDVLLAKPNHPGAYALLGVIAAERGQHGQAANYLEQAIQQNSNVGSWHSNLSLLYRRYNRVDDAIRASDAAMALEPGNAGFLVNASLAYMDKQDWPRAKTLLLKTLGLQPDNPTAHLALGQILLMNGEMQPGWMEYEWRNKMDMAKGTLPPMSTPEWNGMQLDGRLIAVADQGFGDSLQFARYIPLAATRCKELVIGCSPELQPLISQIPGAAAYVSRWEELGPSDAHIRLSSLPYYFRTELNTIPLREPYIAADPERQAAWADYLNTTIGTQHIRVGIAWSGRPTHPNDHRRSLRLANLLPLSEIPGVRFVAVQKPVPASDAAEIPRFAGLTDLAERLPTFAETAALVANLDLLITIDSGVAHLAGAMGKPIWIMLPKPNDWRWLLEREDSPWYPSLTLIRQPVQGDWASVIATAATRLRALVHERFGGNPP